MGSVPWGLGERGFKVDLRIIYDTVRKSKNEVDLANVEVAKPTAPLHKIANDKAKLFIESKCVLDRIVSENRATTSTAVPALQISGTVELYSLRLVKDGLYAAVCEGAATLPGTPKNVHALRQLYSLLARFKAAITRVADLELADDQDINDPGLADFTRPTWIPPRENGRLPPLPEYLFTRSF
ncbi:hypothetical protein BX666DRAFT_468177 [Dichotomocladium elegans]|nr:hypothetical protein BX666DRAFT_468177 [Dichotomocladium elegans]